MISGDIIENYEKILIIMFNIRSYACAISDSDRSEVILTGGYKADEGARKDVTAYNLQGRLEILPQLQKGRQYHACSSYKKSETETVRN